MLKDTFKDKTFGDSSAGNLVSGGTTLWKVVLHCRAVSDGYSPDTTF